MKKNLLLIVCSIFSLFHMVSQASYKELPSITINFGESNNQLGSLGSGNDSWHPLFFAVLPDGSVAIPDYYKERIAIFDVKGTFLKEVQAEGIVSPRMNYFAVSSSGNFVVLNDSVLYALSSDGTVLWNIPFPMGVFPGAIYAGTDAVFFSVMDGGLNKGFSVEYEQPYEISELTEKIGNAMVPYIQASGRKVGYTLSDDQKFNSTSQKSNVLAKIISISPEGNTYWFYDSEESIFLSTEKKSILHTWEIPDAASNSTSWHWIDISFLEKNPLLYSLRSSLRGIEIGRLELELQ